MVEGTLRVENGKILFRNFEGKAGKFNTEGRRSFTVLLDTPIAKQLEEDGWNIRWLEPRDPDEDKQACLQVFVRYTNIPPRIVLVTGKEKKTVLEESDIKILDWADIEKADMVIRPYNWEVNGKTGVKAFVKTLYVTITPDEFESKYRDVPDAGMPYLDEEDDD